MPLPPLYGQWSSHTTSTHAFTSLNATIPHATTMQPHMNGAGQFTRPRTRARVWEGLEPKISALS